MHTDHTIHTITEDLSSSTPTSPSTELDHELAHTEEPQIFSVFFEKESLEKIGSVTLPALPPDYAAKLSKDNLGEENHTAQPEEDFPDGGVRAWAVVFGMACCTFSTFGFLNCWGVYQAYYQGSLLKEYSPSAIAWIGSLQYSLVFFPGLLVGRLFDIGYFRHLLLSSSVVLVTATLLIGECTKYWHLLLCQGVAVGLACGSVFGCCNAAIAHWFKKKRSRALGYGAIGSAVSGTVIPIAAKNLIPLVGFPWTMRILSFMLFITLGACNLTVRTRLPPKKVKGGLFNIAVFKNAAFTTYCLATLITHLGIYTFPTYVSVSAIRLGHSREVAFYFLTFSNASSFFGRWSAGFLGDSVGPLNAIIPYIFLIGTMIFIWPFTHSTASLIVISVIYGFCIGSYVSLSLNPVMNMGGEADVGRRVGMFLTIMASGVVSGPPISGVINARTSGFEVVGVYAGSTIILGACGLIIVRYLLLGGWNGKI